MEEQLQQFCEETKLYKYFDSLNQKLEIGYKHGSISITIYQGTRRTKIGITIYRKVVTSMEELIKWESRTVQID